MLFEDVLNLRPRFTAFPLRELADSFDDPTCDPEIESAALFGAEFGTVFPDTICCRHWLRLVEEIVAVPSLLATSSNVHGCYSPWPLSAFRAASRACSSLRRASKHSAPNSSSGDGFWSFSFSHPAALPNNVSAPTRSANLILVLLPITSFRSTMSSKAHRSICLSHSIRDFWT